MSYDQSIYGKQEAMRRKENLSRCLSRKGWEVRFLSYGAFPSDELRPVLASEGPLEANCLIAGWRKNSRYADVLAAWIDNRELHHFRALTAETVCFGCCEMALHPMTQHESDYEEQQRHFPERYRRIFREADMDFQLGSSAGRSPTSFEFQHVVWEAIGELTGGLMENPQEGILKQARKSP